MTTPKDFVLLEPLLAESLQEYLARHGLKLGDKRVETAAAVARWRSGPAWAQTVTDWRSRENRRQDELRAERQQTFDPYHEVT